jgi:hypothetical protein
MRHIYSSKTGRLLAFAFVWAISSPCINIGLTGVVSAQSTALDEKPTTDATVTAPVDAPIPAAATAESRVDIAVTPDAAAPRNAPAQSAPIAPAPPSPPAPSSPFEFKFTGAVAGTLFAQDAPFIYGSGIGALIGPFKTKTDGWLMGGDVRQTRVMLSVRGPEVLGATPLGAVEVEMTGGEEVHSTPGITTTVAVRDPAGNVIGTARVPSVSSVPQGDENLLPKLRTAFVELNWKAGEDIVRVGQYHNLMLAMIPASGAHPATIGYMGGQLGWRSPGVTYSHRFDLTADMNLNASVQINRNSWNDNATVCSGTSLPPATNCLPNGVSLGEAGLPQFEARVLLSSGKVPSPWPHYYPNLWQVYLVGHWDQKDLSGVGYEAVAPSRDSMQTMAAEVGGKVRLGPVLVAANGWYGKNAGSLYGHMFQMQSPDKPDVTGFGAWGQAGLSFTKKISLWVFGGIDKPNRDEVIKAGFYFLQNIKLDAMLAYVDGPFVVTLEMYHVITDTRTPDIPATATTPAIPASESTTHGNQPSVTVIYMF